MGVAAQHEGGVADAGEASHNGRLRRQDGMAAHDILQQVFLIAPCGAAVTGEHRAVREPKCGREAGEPFQMRG
jgi:hypothetical protein